MNREDLTCRQRKVIEALHGESSSILVLGGPGTGKTTVALWAARSYLETLSSQGQVQTRVLFLTFSRSAVSQIVRRSVGVISAYKDRIEISTFHGLAFRLLRSFGRYSGHGVTLPQLQSPTREKLLGKDPSRLVYDDLMPGALGLLRGSTRIRSLLSARWPLVICDEVQDTGPEQWALLQELVSGKLLMLGDANQMIYTFLEGVSPERFSEIRASANAEIELERQSHRDPSGVIPALADSVRRREFGGEAVIEAQRSGRLKIVRGAVPEAHAEILASEVAEARQRGSRSISIFGHSNASVAELAEALSDSQIDHVLVGIPDAHAEALAAMNTMCRFCVGAVTFEEVRLSLAIFLTACVRGNAPAMAFAIMGEGTLPDALAGALAGLEAELREATDGGFESVASSAMGSWHKLPLTAGHKPWRRAAAHFLRLARPLIGDPCSSELIERLTRDIESARANALIDLDQPERGPVSLMNFHQTKGREADTVIHVYRADDYFGDEDEPFEKHSRLLNVTISRARDRVVLVLPEEPHPLVAPFASL